MSMSYLSGQCCFGDMRGTECKVVAGGHGLKPLDEVITGEVCLPHLSKEMQGASYRETSDSPPSTLLLVLISHHRNDVKVPKIYLEDREGFLGALSARTHRCVLCGSMDSTLLK